MSFNSFTHTDHISIIKLHRKYNNHQNTTVLTQLQHRKEASMLINKWA